MDIKIGAADTCKPLSTDVGSLPTDDAVTIHHSSVPFNSVESTLGRHLARRLVQVGVNDVFSVPGDFNLTLLDHLLAEPELNLIGCCNELNAGYAADGYARSRGVGACVVTFTVGGLSVLNAISGAYSENLPVICIVGGPNSNDYGTNRILHHTIGLPDFSQERRCFQTITCYQAVVNNLEDAHESIDTAISTALKESKPVYISISCNLPAIPHPTFSREPVPFSLSPKSSNQMGLEAAVEAAAEFLNKSVKPVMVGGPKLRVAKACQAFVELADASGYALAVMPSAKGLVPEQYPHFIGTYWGAVSTAFCAEIVESADAYLFAGPVFNDYSSVGYSLLLKKEKAIIVQPDRVTISNGPAFGCVLMKDFLRELAKRLKRNTTAYESIWKMSIVPKETIEVTAQSIGINNLSPDAALALAPDVEYRLREIMQEAIKCMRHSKRNLLTTDDVDSALKLRNVEPIYGFASGDPLRFRRALGHKDLFYVDDRDVDFKDVIEAPLPKAPLDSSVVCHWLAIEGVQPAIPENAPVEVISVPSDTKLPEQKEDGLPVDIRLPVKHILSRELQLYFDKITELTVSRSDSVLFKEALVSLATDSGLHPLVPYFTCFIADEVSRGLSNFPVLFALMRLVWSLLQNPHIHIEPYLHQLMPSVVTCLVAKRLGNRLADNHWELRDFAATIVASVCRRFAHVYNNLQTRLTKTLLHAFLDPKRALPQHYGAIQGLAAFGPNVVHLLIVPNLETYLKLLEPEMLPEKQRNKMKRHEAWRVYGALQRAAGQCIYDKLKIFPSLPSPPANTIFKTNARIVHSCPVHKRKTTADTLDEQQPLKKIRIDGPSLPLSSNSSDMEIDRSDAALGDSVAGPSSSKEIQDSVSERRERRGKFEKQILKTPALLNQAWKDDLDSGHLLESLFELFGESIFPFIPTPEMSMF